MPWQQRCHADNDFFESQVRPLLIKRCGACHSGDKAGGGLSLETRAGWQTGGESGPAIVPGKPEESLLVDAIHYRSLEMPPADKGGKLSDDEIGILTRWIAIGAPDPRDSTGSIAGMTRDEARSWWAFQPLSDPQETLTSERIDAFLQQEIEAQGLAPSRPADRRMLIRRSTYDLTGLPPTPDQVNAFLADDSEDVFDRLIDQLLASPQYGVHWARHWLDVVRYADTAGENTDRPLPHAWRYRNWVLDAINRDLPYDDFVRHQICGDILLDQREPAERAAGIVATGYLAIARRFGHDIDKDIHLTYEDIIDNLGKNFLGLTLGCARCHDHKYDPVTAADYYALYGVLASTQLAFPGCEPKGQPRDLVPLITPTEIEALTADYQARLAQYEQRLQAASRETQRLKALAEKTSRSLVEATVGEGQSIALRDSGGVHDKLVVRRGEVLQLTVLPNANHGADTTRVEWTITKLGLQRKCWQVADLIGKFSASNSPAIEDDGAVWCLLDVTDGPQFLHEKKLSVGGQPGLIAWAIGETPSTLVNISKDPVSVWTTLPGESFFVHPGDRRNVALAWVCPETGEYDIRGFVSDAHPAGLDGVAFRLQQIASPEYGEGLVALGALNDEERVPRPQSPVFPLAYAVAEGEVTNARMHLRGDPEQLGDEVPRRWLSVFGGESLAVGGGSGRHDLANQIVAHPLFARVCVNRIWQQHFGRGLVETPNDFGSRGAAPTHLELLDALAAQFRAGGYRIKPLHRLIMKTAAYQRSSIADAEQAQADPQNRWLSRFSRRRLTAEEIRDSLLGASGQLDLSVAQAHPFPPESDWQFTQHNPFHALYETNRRSLFLMVQRQRRHPFLALFDGADPNSSTATRHTTTVPTQALYFLNDPFFHAQSTAFAERLLMLPEDATRVQVAYGLLFQREPSESEMQKAIAFLSRYPGDSQEQWSAYARVLLASSEFLYVD